MGIMSVLILRLNMTFLNRSDLYIEIDVKFCKRLI